MKGMLTHPDKILFPQLGLSKQQLSLYYERFGSEIITELARRPLVLIRCPAGVQKKCFFQKHFDSSQAPDLPRIKIKEKEGVGQYLYVEKASDLVSLVQLNALEIHCWSATVDDLEHPDRMIFDLDPDPHLPVMRVVQTARRLHRLLLQLKLRSFVRATGGKGLHVVVPLAPVHDWDRVKSFAAALAGILEEEDPDKFTTNMSKKKRAGKVFVDIFRNSRGQTAIANYSTRAKPGAPVAAPLRWDELNGSMSFSAVHVQSLGRRLSALKSPAWPEPLPSDQRLPQLEQIRPHRS